MKSFWGLLKEYKITVPMLQRDYVQGQMRGKVPTVRENLLNAICEALKEGGPRLELDFVYGYAENGAIAENEQQVFFPLDGQQRLTTLYLLHWYVAVKEQHLDEANEALLHRFSYYTRPSSRDFCSKLSGFCPEDLKPSIRSTIINQPWFYAAWAHDATISSMLNMLDAIQEKFETFEIKNAWARLVGDDASIVFHVLPMEQLDLQDDLYIKMNSRGKALTDFEYFKARFSGFLKSDQARIFGDRVDRSWSDLFWDRLKQIKSQDVAQQVDAGMMRFIRYYTTIIAAKKGYTLNDATDLLVHYQHIYEEPENVAGLFEVMDDLVLLYKENPDFFSTVFYLKGQDYSEGKTKLFTNKSTCDLFQTCIEWYDPTKKPNPFSIGDQLLLYGCLLYRKNSTKDFSKRIRHLRNLVANSEDTLRNEYLPSLLASVEEIIMDGALEGHKYLSGTQLEDELRKKQFLQENPNLRTSVEQLEDHPILQGCLLILSLTPKIKEDAIQFHRVFHEDNSYVEVSRAMMTIGDYSQRYGLRRRYGNRRPEVWKDLFTPSQRRGDYEKTRIVLQGFLRNFEKRPDGTISHLVQDWERMYDVDPHLEKEWAYYYIRYPEFRQHDQGYYYKPDETKLYESFIIRSIERGGKNWDPMLRAIKSVVGSEVSLGNYADPLVLSVGTATLRIWNRNEGFILEALETEGKGLLERAVRAGWLDEEYRCAIKQSQNGLDLEDRVKKGIGLIDVLISLKQ